MRLTDFDVLTFDCYGTLIDWESGMFAALEPLLRRAARRPTKDEILAAHARHESAQQTVTPTMRYSDLLAVVCKRLAEEFGAAVSWDECLSYGRSIGDWPAFPDSVDALKYLGRHYKLAILSNVETKTLQASAKFFGAPFLALITAEALKSYKPAPRHWEEALTRLHMPKESVLHVAGSLFHDILPARALGFETVWINRRGEPVPEGIDPAHVFPDLLAFSSALLGAETVV